VFSFEDKADLYTFFLNVCKVVIKMHLILVKISQLHTDAKIIGH